MKIGARRGFTLQELIAVCGVVLLCLVLLFPVPNRPRPAARRIACVANLKQIGTALSIHTEDYDRRLPPYGYTARGTLVGVPYLLSPYLDNSQPWRCPEDRHPESVYDRSPSDTSVSYGYNWLGLTRDECGVPLREVANPRETAAFLETSSYLAVPAGLHGAFSGTSPEYRHAAKTHVLWLDGRVSPSGRELEAQEPRDPRAPLTTVYRYWDRD